MKILYTGFKGQYNSSYRLVNGIAGEKLFLTNSFEGLKNDIENIYEEFDAVYMFGLDKNLKNSVRIEKCASKDGELVYSKMKLDGIEKRLVQYGVENYISDTPTFYLCNEAYYHMLKKMNGRVVFIHIPSMKNITDELVEELKNTFELIKEASS